MKNRIKNMIEMEILTQTLNEMVEDGVLHLVNKHDRDNPTGEDLYVTPTE